MRLSLTDCELRDACRYVVGLFLRAEAPNSIHGCGQQSLALQFPMLLQGFNHKSLTKFLSSIRYWLPRRHPCAVLARRREGAVAPAWSNPIP